MRHSMAAPTSSLPSLMMPCPVCAGRMAYNGRRLVAPDVEDTIYGCRRCGAELNSYLGASTVRAKAGGGISSKIISSTSCGRARTAASPIPFV